MGGKSSGPEKGALSVNKGVEQPPNVNPELKNKLKNTKKNYSVNEYFESIREGNRIVLSQVITLIESSRSEHQELAQEIIEKCLPFSQNSIRIGITGVPGAGKSTFIEALGKKVTSTGRKLAVLTIDPTSEHSGGSILGDKTRMENLASDPNAYIRPSPSAGTLGGVARKTRESIIVCEAAGFDIIFVETVGVGQSETLVHSMVDFFLLLMLAGAGDELQGIKRGIMEMADTIAITKADGSNINRAEIARNEYLNAVQLFPPGKSGWKPRVVTCSALEYKGINEIWEIIFDYVELTKSNGAFKERRMNQSVFRMHETIAEYQKNSFYQNPEIVKILPAIEKDLTEGRITSYKAASLMFNKYLDCRKKKE